MEEAFLQDFRLAGLRSTQYACYVAVAGYLLIWGVDILFNGWLAVAAVRRIIVIALLALIILVVFLRPSGLLRHYNGLLGSLVLVAYVSSVSVTHLFRDDDPTAIVNPAALIGIWLIYGFVRLPLKVAVILGVVGGACALLGSRVTNLHDPTVGTLIYLVIANALGITQSRSVELRERQLFLQRRTLEQAEAELRHRNLLAEQSSAEKTRLIAAVGHDLRQPMMAAVLHMSVLEHRLQLNDSRGVMRQASRVRESVKLLGDTLEHLLLAARYEAGAEPISIKDVSLVNLLTKLGDLSEPQATEMGSNLIIRLPGYEFVVATDEQTLLRSLVNLVSNALKFARPCESGRSRVVVRSSVINDVCRIVVADNGIGIADSDTEAIWEPFFQVNNFERNRENGLGLGLYLVRKSLTRLDGHTIRVVSTLGRGTLFILTLPGRKEIDRALVDEKLGEGAQMEVLGSPGMLRGMYVLLIEDDHEALEALQAQLDEWGVLWSSARTTHEVLRIHSESERSVDAVLADYRLPGQMNGIALIRTIREALGYEADAILMTAEVDSDRIIEHLPTRTVLLSKPFDPELLRRLLALAHRRAIDYERNLRSLGSSEYPSPTLEPSNPLRDHPSE